MIGLSKLATIRGRSLTRKCALLLEGLQRQPFMDADYARGVARILSGAELSDECREPLRAAAFRLVSLPSDAVPEEFLRAVDALRHACIRASGQSPADWDLLPPRAASVAGATGEAGSAPADGRLRAYLEDIRSPFNVGTIFRTADAFGFSEILLSPDCADPRHPRALRSSMGAVDLVPWRRASLEEAAAQGPRFALELGGTPLGDFDFPERGTVILGSEELGVSTAALAQCDLGIVSIPMHGVKASMNVAVAFGVLSWAWRSRRSAAGTV